MKRIFLMLLLFSIGVVQSLAAQQSFRVKGTVTDNDGTPVIGATIVVAGTSVGVTTGVKGSYSIACKKDASLQFSFIGLESQTVKVLGKETINVVLQASSIMMDEVVAIGYGNMRRKDLTGSVSSISGKTISDIPVSDLAQALVGRLPGVNIRQSSGAIDAEISIRVRGGTSITQDNSPLYIIDGVPSDDGIGGISTNDIESIDVLKDASATSIYGSRGANGVMLITTKGAKKEGLSVSYNGSYGISKNTGLLDVLEAHEFVALEFERTSDVDNTIRRYGELSDINRNYPAGSSINWQDATFGNAAASQSHNISVSGGSATSKFVLSYTHDKDDGIMINSGKSRDYLRLRYDFKPKKIYSLGFNATYSELKTQGSSSLSNHKSLLASMLKYRPTAGLHMSNYEFLNAVEDPAIAEDNPDDTSTRNPLANARNETNQKVTRLLTGSAYASIRFSKSISYRGTINFTRKQYQQDEFYTAEHPKAEDGSGPFGNIRQTFSDKMMYNNTLSYKKNISKIHDIEVMLGQEYTINKNTGYGFGGTGFPDNNFGLDDMGLASLGNIPSSSRSQSNQLSFFARAGYAVKSKYYLTLTMRADGSSKFGKNNKWGYFPSAALAWRISDEELVKKWNVFSDLKLRVSYGATGNSRIGDYRSLDLMESGKVAVDEGIEIFYRSANLANPNLKWETNVTANAALDMAFLDNRISATIEVYNTDTKDLLMDAPVPYSSGYTTIMRNVGSTRNRGVEFSISTYNINKKRFSWSTTFNISMNRGKVTGLNEAGYMELSTSWNSNDKFSDYIVQVGKPIGLMYGYVSDGIYTVDDFTWDAAGKATIKAGVPYISDQLPNLAPGYPKYKNVDGSEDNLISSSDKTVIGKGEPKFFGGFGNTFTIYDFDLSVFMDFTYGNDLYNANRLAYSNLNGENQNSLKSAYYGRFITVDENGNSLMQNPEALAALNKNARNPSIRGSTSLKFTDEYVEDGSFLRLQNITIGYSVPKKLLKKIRLNTLRVYASFYNLAVFTKYTGFDPEVGMSLSDRNKYPSLTPGLDYGSHPKAKKIMFGLNITF